MMGMACVWIAASVGRLDQSKMGTLEGLRSSLVLQVFFLTQAMALRCSE
jgi:hypothetical protein